MKTLSENYQDLITYMGKSADVQAWNERREQAKEIFTQETISRLDASGYITKSLGK